LPKDFIRKLKR